MNLTKYIIESWQIKLELLINRYVNNVYLDFIITIND